MSANYLAKSVDVQRVARAFKKGLPTYHHAASVQAEIAKHLAHEIAIALNDKHIGQALEFGCGTGHLTKNLVENFTFDRLVLNDLLPDCAPHVKAIAPGAEFISGAIDDLELPTALDLITSASTIQWLPNLTASLSMFSRALAENGLLAISGFGTRHFKLLRQLRGESDEMNYIDAEDWHKFLPADMALIKATQRDIQIEFENFGALLRHLRQTGVNGVPGERLSKTALEKLEQDYCAGQGHSDNLSLNYHAVWVLARKHSG